MARSAARDRAPHARQLAGRDPRPVDRGAARRRRAEPLGVPGITTLPPEHHTLILAAHAWEHQPLGRLGNLIDVAVMLAGRRRRGRPARARWGCARMWRTTRNDGARGGRRRGPLGSRAALWAATCATSASARSSRWHLKDLLAPLWGCRRVRRARVAREGRTLGRGAGEHGVPSSAACGLRCATPAARDPSTTSRVTGGEAGSDRAATAGLQTCTGARSTARSSRSRRAARPTWRRTAPARCCGGRWPRARPATRSPTSSCSAYGIDRARAEADTRRTSSRS